MDTISMKRALYLLSVLFLCSGLNAQDFNGLFTYDHTTSTAPIMGPGSPNSQVDVSKISLQGTLGGKIVLAEGQWISGTAWGRLATLSGDSPMDLPENKVTLESRILEALLGWEILPATLSLEVGKRVIHPSSGFYATPLNLLSRGPKVPGKSVGDFEEGWAGLNITWFHELFTLTQFLSPRMEWPSQGAPTMAFISEPQELWQSLSQISIKIQEADLKILGLAKTTDGTDWAGQGGLGLEGLVGEGLTLRTEGVWDWEGFQVMTGFTWTLTNQVSIMAEYSLNHLDNQGFFRVAGPLGDHLEGEAWTALNLNDRSGFSGTSAKFSADHWSLKGSWIGPWGPVGTQWGDSPLKWKLSTEFGVVF